MATTTNTTTITITISPTLSICPCTSKITPAVAVDTPVVRAYAQWVAIRISNKSTIPIKLRSLEVLWGMLYANGNKDKEMDVDHYDNEVVDPSGHMELSACDRADASLGTAGRFDLVDTSAKDEIIRSFYWEGPLDSKENQWTVSGEISKCHIQSSGATLSGGLLGTIVVDIGLSNETN
ncbi:Aegerolysin-domain-containing protein [Dichomitus squalens LYAD-421 SS1]|uniref:Aegerolysin-domain-containing protein n=1 Tax=Dichomitus squalens (strain LYAD-421) TaxID=732165 RepID=R7SN62_DICSQ|nr:Aegerolysin-domain-containing protein [Dichomitus squalens LYAD-421 SS1]EJF57343.1 Aegerolysin-domain-containing protein [Dichomitus squalens LYAD-421 SS1]